MSSRLSLSVFIAAAAAALLAGCGSSQATQAASPAAPGTASGSGGSDSRAGSTPAAAGSPGTPAGTMSACTVSELTIAYTGNSRIREGALDGMSKADNVVTFTNHGSVPCQTGGYPGVAALNSAGRQIMQAVRSPGTLRLITLAPRATASAMVSANTASCTSLTAVAGLLITAPNGRTSTRLGPAGTFCLNSLQVGTLQPGDAAGLKL